MIGLVNVSKIVDSEALELTIDELPLIVAAILPVEPALAILLALIELSFVSSGSVIPLLFTIAMLSVFNPLPRVDCIVGINKDSIPICFVISPLAFVHVSIGMSHSAASIRLISPPDPLIFRAIRPDLNANTISFPGPLVELPLVKAALANIFVAVDKNSSNLRFYPRFLLNEGVQLLFGHCEGFCDPRVLLRGSTSCSLHVCTLESPATTLQVEGRIWNLGLLSSYTEFRPMSLPNS